MHRTALSIHLPILAAGLILLLGAALAQAQHDHAQPTADSPIQTPAVIVEEHKHLHEQLAAAMQAGGKTAAAAEQVRDALKEHFAEEERYAMPPLGLLDDLAQGEATEAMRPAIAMARQVEQNLPRFHEEHAQIKEALRRLALAAEAENKPDHAEFAHRLLLHAEHEERVLYPTTILIGKYLQTQLQTPAP